MGRTAHEARRPAADNRTVAVDTDALIGTVEELTDAHDGDRAVIEDKLTEGYAHALSLEAERRRLEGRIVALAAGLVSEGAGARVAELGDLGRRLKLADRELLRLRSALGALRARLAS
jgi:hypothetical protein